MLVLLHGSNASGPEMEPLAKALRPYFDVRALNLLGHGGRPVPDGYSLEEMSEDLIAWLDAEGIGQCDLLGYSVGGTIALHAARHHPRRVRAFGAIAAKHVFDRPAVDHVVYLSQPERLARPGSVRKEQMERAHGADNWEKVALNTCELFRRMGEAPPLGDEDLRETTPPALIVCGEKDPLVPLEDARRMAELLPSGRLATFPGGAHPLGNVPLGLVARAFRDFIRQVEAGTFAKGPPLNLAPTLVSGGLSGEPVRVSVRQDPTRS